MNFTAYAPRFLRVKRREGGSMLPLNLKPIQWDLERTIQEAHALGRPALVIINKSRRLGCSTYVAGRFTHRAVTRPYQRAIVMAHRGDDAKKIFEIYELMHEHLPPSLRPKRAGGKGAKIDLFKMYSTIDVGSAESRTFGRGGDSQIVHLSEVAYYPDPAELLAAILPGVSANGDGIIILESTANGPHTWWHEEWMRAVDGQAPAANKHIPHFVPKFYAWFQDPDHRLAAPVPREDWDEEEKELARRSKVDGHQVAWLRWRQEVDCRGRADRRRREYPATIEESFSSVGQKAWDDELIIGSSAKPGIYKRKEALFRGTMTATGLHKDPAGKLLVFELPMPGAEYVIGADPAGGVRDRDLACGEVYRVGKGVWPVQVAEYADHDDPINFAQTLTLLGTYYRKGLLA